MASAYCHFVSRGKACEESLDLSKIEAEKIEITCLKCSPLEIVEDALTAVGISAREKGIMLSPRCETPIPSRVICDPVRLRQVLLNLIGNAVKFTDSGSVTVSLRFVETPNNSKHLEFEVKDTGRGIPEDKLGEIFDPFTQADPSMTRGYGGTGLGLAICRQLADLVGGKLTVKSELGVGSLFTFALPCEIPERVPMVTSGRAIEPEKTKTLEKKANLTGRILVVEDNADNQDLLRRELERSGATVEIAGDGRTAVKKCSEGNFDLILMDIRMPVMDGFETLKTLHIEGFDRPVVALTAHAMREDKESVSVRSHDASAPRTRSSPAAPTREGEASW